MFLRSIREEMNDFQIGFQWTTALDKLKTIDISEIDWRMLLILEIMKYARAFNMQTFVESNNLASIQDIKKLLIQAQSYVGNDLIVWAKLKIVMENLSYEIMRDHNWNFDYTLIKEILEWKKDIKDFLNIPFKRNLTNSLFGFTWKDWKKYSGKGIAELAKLKQVEVIDIVSILKSDIVEIQNAIDFYNDEKNHELIKKDFWQIRLAWMSILTQIMSWEEWNFTKFVSDLAKKEIKKEDDLIEKLVVTPEDSGNTEWQEDEADWTGSVIETQTEDITPEETTSEDIAETAAPF